jgi:hypothetical protein
MAARAPEGEGFPKRGIMARYCRSRTLTHSKQVHDMKTAIFPVATIALLFVSLPSYSQNKDDGPVTEEQLVLAVEDEYVKAEVDRDEATLRRLVMINSASIRARARRQVKRN